MPNHKLTLLGHPASKAIQRVSQQSDLFGTERRLAYADGVIAVSGYREGIALARDLYDVDLRSDGLLERFRGMIQGFGFQKATALDPDVCAEAHLWMTLVGLHE